MPIIRIPGRSSRVPSKGGKSVKGSKRPIKGPKRQAPPPRRDSVSSIDSSSSLSSPANLSNDDGYSGVEDVSESDADDADHVFAAEQEHIANQHSSPRPTPDFNIDVTDDDADDADDDESDDDSSTPSRESRRISSGGAVFVDSSSDAESWNGFIDEQDQCQPPLDTPMDDDDDDDDGGRGGSSGDLPPAARHVHFADLPNSDSDTDDDGDNHDGFFPDIFVPEDALDSRFRQEIGLDNDDYSSDSQTYWDHHGDDEFEGFSDNENQVPRSMFQDSMGGPVDLPLEPHGKFNLSNDACGPGNDSGDFFAEFRLPWDISRSNDATAVSTPSMVLDVPAQDDDDESDGYESDGETTEEDEPVLIPKDSPVRRSVSRGSSDAEAAPESPFTVAPTATRKRVCVLNPLTQKLIIFTPQKKPRSGLSAGPSPGQGQPDYFSLSTLSFVSGAPIAAGNGTLNPFYGSEWMAPIDGLSSMGIPSAALTPALFPNLDSEGSSIRTDEDEEDEGERNLDVDLFLAFDSEDSDAEGQHGDITKDRSHETEGNDGNAETASGRSSAADGHNKATKAYAPLAHLGGMNVGAFRRNQTTQQLIARGEATPESLAFSNSLFHGTLRGIRDGALPAAATSLTPERRRKPQPVKSPVEAASLKRKAFGTGGEAHKKRKSISDVGSMHI